MNNKFILITTCYNVNPYIQHNITVNKFQSHTNALFVYVDDKSTDGTYDSLLSLTKEDDRFLVIQNPNNGSQSKAYMYAIDYLEVNNLISDEDIIVEVDGDDWLSSTFVLEYLNHIYQNPDVWMTYGQYQHWPNGTLGGHFSMEINDQVDAINAHRKYPFAYSHTKTYKYWLFNKIDRKDLIDPLTNELFAAAWDHALCIPMVEMAGKKHIFRVEEVTYIYNVHDDLQSESKSRLDVQKQTEQRIRQGRVYNKLLNR
jgi:glycosyltransferase involved in cell wall biosynthesis